MSMIWTPQLATGVRQIDLQHQELFELINELDAANAAGNKRDALADVLPRLGAYVLFHFGTEEAMLSQLSSDRAQQHRQHHQQQHAEFSERVAQLREQPPDEIDLTAFVAYLQRWLTQHIMKTDLELGRLLLERPSIG